MFSRFSARWKDDQKRKGFTLLELLISLALFTIVAIAAVRQISQLRTTKEAALKKRNFTINSDRLWQ